MLLAFLSLVTLRSRVKWLEIVNSDVTLWRCILQHRMLVFSVFMLQDKVRYDFPTKPFCVSYLL